MNKNPYPPAPSLSEWLRLARTPYLHFLRNLTPQILLASLAWILALKLNFTKIDLANWVATLGFFAFLTLFLFAVHSNISLFMSELFPGLMPWVREREGSLESANVSKLRLPMLLLGAALRERKLEIALAVFAMVMLQFVFAGILVSSIGAALGFIRTTHG